ncbi:AAA family ATPase [Rhodopirellula baltica]|uniref:ATPase associated with various cellular activities AAA_5 n=2 Tax=Rhodopirellula baltica TaxID=265606 RepID=F2AKU9_RHOBT|nr:AAA family ATPase [Rhodopirellula baltica]EGF29729.1 ATPase associated with various cellular activities AAA_5 [Rhodopirellula baltica WH47]CAD74553.1 probable regulatory protein [Rhodopirellula baltica SH 1]HBE64870.1 ATPase [Rhodopirellula baltica]
MNSPSPNPSEDRPSKHSQSDRFAREPEVVQIGGVELKLAHPYEAAGDWIGQNELLMQLLACWLTVDETDIPLTPRLIGSPGVGKTQLAIAATKRQGLPLYIYQCTADTRPEDLLITPVLSRGGEIAYHASPLVSAMITGGVCILDEGNRMNEKSWASLAPLFDTRRYVESIVAGITIPASPEFRSAVTMNQDESTFEIPDYILSRLQPTLQVGFPNKQDEMAILQYHLPFAEPEMLALTVDFLQRSHELKLDFSPRDGINLLRFAIKRMKQNPSHPVAHDAAWQEALEKCLGDEAVDLESLAERRKRTLGGDAVPLGLADLFFDSDDPLHPDREDDDDDDLI